VSKCRRLFFALVPDPEVGSRIEKLQNSLAVSGRAARPHQFHATLAFLGMQQQESLSVIHAAASRLVFKPCQLVLDRVGQFKRAGVLWLGVSEVPAELLDFQRSLVGAMLDAGIGHDPKPWEFHITLYRKMRKPPPIMDPVAIEWKVSGFDLIESVSAGNGVEYHSIGHWKPESQVI
jgi:2'-5' RNA ligase